MPEYISTFIDEPDLLAETILLNTPDTVNGSHTAVVLVEEKETDKPRINLVISSGYSSPFRETKVINDTILIGWGNLFAFYNLVARKSKLLKLHSYFGSYRIYNDHIYVCSESDITCLSMDGEVLWKSATIAIDGVIIDSFDERTLNCSCEMDPPGGWHPCSLDLLTGMGLKINS